MTTIVKTTNAILTTNSEATATPPSRTPIAIAARRLRPALGPGSGAAATIGSDVTSDLEQLDFLVPQDVVDLRDVAISELIALLLGAVYVVFAGFAVFAELVESFLCVPADVADRHLCFFALCARQFDVVA